MIARSFLNIAAAVLILIIGAYLWNHFFNKPRITTKIEWYEKPIFLPAKVESKVGNPTPPTPETAKRDTVFLAAPCDSLRKWAMEKMQPLSAEFEDSASFADSTTIFFAREITTIDVDPWTRLITKARHFEDAYLKAARVTTTETTTEVNWLVSAVAFVLGMLTALLLS
jgi:hypothetical protein